MDQIKRKALHLFFHIMADFLKTKGLPRGKENFGVA